MADDAQRVTGRLRPPFRYFGGKGHLVPSLVPLFPSHDTFVDVFGGAGNVILAKPAGIKDVYNDLDPGPVNLYRVLQDRDKYRLLERRVRNSNPDRELFDQYKSSWSTLHDEIERAFGYLVVARFSRMGHVAAPFFNVTGTPERVRREVKRWHELGAQGLARLHERLRQIIIETLDWKEVVRRYDSSTTLLYLDPPYVPQTRRQGGYRFELSFPMHEDLVVTLPDLTSKIILSGYNHSVYLPLEQAGWTRWTKHVILRTANTGAIMPTLSMRRRTLRTESLWVSPNAANFVSLVAPAYGWTLASTPLPLSGQNQPQDQPVKHRPNKAITKQGE